MAGNTATERRAKQGLVAGKGDAANVKSLVSTVELPASSAGDTIDFGDIPADARIMGVSTVSWDDLHGGTTAPTLDIGLVAVDGNVTDDPDALNDGLDVTTAGSSSVVKDIADYGKAAWEFVANQDKDPGGALTVQGVIADAATDTAGTVTLELLYVMD